jgi:hypothetical protein
VSPTILPTAADAIQMPCIALIRRRLVLLALGRSVPVYDSVQRAEVYAAPSTSIEVLKEKHEMRSPVHVAVLTLVAFAPLAAQTPQGWKVRVDRSTAASDPDAAGDIKFVTAGSGFHATNPKAAVYWNPANTVAGTYTLKGTFTLMKPSGPQQLLRSGVRRQRS